MAHFWKNLIISDKFMRFGKWLEVLSQLENKECLLTDFRWEEKKIANKQTNQTTGHWNDSRPNCDAGHTLH